MRITHVAILLTLAYAPLSAQRSKEPRRPTLKAAADTNDSRAYYSYAMQQISADPDKAADALYWSARLEPTFADAFYARRVALLLSDKSRLLRYWSGDKRTVQSSEIRQIDSLFYHALTLNPFVSRSIDRQLFEGVMDEFANSVSRNNPRLSAAEVRYAIDREMMTSPAADRAWMAYGDGRLDDALRLYAEAIKKDKRNEPLRVDRARIFYQRNELDSALAELTLANAELKKRDSKELVFVYQSKALTEHSLAMIEVRRGSLQAAKDAFGRALQEDLSYFPAHVQLALVELNAHDTSAALAELDLATQMRDDDVVGHFLYGYALSAAGKLTDAEAQLRRAIALDPVYALPVFLLADAVDRLGRSRDAIAQYQSFLSISAESDPRRELAATRMTALEKAAPPPGVLR